MKMKNLLLVIIATLGLSTSTIAQNLPNYISANGLVGWWPFNGNANDESLNGNNGTVNGATLSDDRNGIANSSYYLNGQTDFISVPDANIMLPSKISISSWVKIPSNYSGNNGVGRIVRSRFYGYTLTFILSNNSINFEIWTNPTNSTLLSTTNIITNDDIWHNIVGTFNGSEIKLYFDGSLVGSLPAPNSNILYSSDGLVMFGRDGNNQSPLTALYQGWIDDIGIWNRALTDVEITNLYSASNCANNTLISPQTNPLSTGSTATFAATSSDPSPSYEWQSDLGQGFQTLNDIGNYSGTNSSSLSIENVQLQNHNQVFRVITTSEECIDTSVVASISILDTCLTIINDTTFISVTDTLLINTLITGINPPNNNNTVKVYPNPANSQITIDYGNFAIMNGYQLKIENSIGQQVFLTNITQQTDYLSLNNWGGNGLYFVHIIDAQGNTIDIRKIVLQ